MDNLILFLNSFISYLLVFFVFGACIVASCFAGITVRKALNKKAAEEKDDTIV